MADPPDPDALARRYVALWQEQMLAVAADPAVADAFARWMSMFAAPAMPGFPGHAMPGFPGHAPPRSEAAGERAAPPGPAAAAGAPGAGNGDLEQLARRMAALEERLASLESAIRGPHRRPRRAAPRRRP